MQIQGEVFKSPQTVRFWISPFVSRASSERALDLAVSDGAWGASLQSYDLSSLSIEGRFAIALRAHDW
jgi:hypothetical protein